MVIFLFSFLYSSLNCGKRDETKELFFNSISSNEILSHFPISSKTIFKSELLMKLYLTPNFFKEEFLFSIIDFINSSKPFPFILL